MRWGEDSHYSLLHGVDDIRARVRRSQRRPPSDCGRRWLARTKARLLLAKWRPPGPRQLQSGPPMRLKWKL